MPSGPGAEEGDDLLRLFLIWSLVRGGVEGLRERRPLGGRGSFGGKKCSKRALLIDTGSVALGSEGNLRVFLGATNCFVVHILWGVVLVRRSAQ